jgi:hypothetical protein
VTGSIYLVGEVRAEVLGIAAGPVIALQGKAVSR